MENNKAIIFYDGLCCLCNGTVRFLIKRDREKVFEFEPLQSKNGQQSLIGKNIFEVNSIVLVNGNTVYTRSNAFIEIIRLLPSPWNWIRILRYVPHKWRDYIYNIIAKYRYQWFGKYKSCQLNS